LALEGVPIQVKTPLAVEIVPGATPAPPPTTSAWDASTAEVAHVVPLEKYGMPPLVPATVNANVPEDVMGEPATEIKPPVKVWATLDTEPVAADEDASNFTVPALFLKYSFSSKVFSASSPATKLPDVGAADAVVL
jgi:hypothetical protein